MHIKLKRITGFILICMPIWGESVKSELKIRDRHIKSSHESLFEETPSPVHDENKALECVLAWQRRDERSG